MENGYLLDTNILIYMMGGNAHVIKQLIDLDQDSFFVSAVTIFELLNGNKDQAHLKNLERLLKRFVPLPFTGEAATLAAELDKRTHREKKFKDLFIAATAMHENLTLVTADRDFKSVKGLKVKWVKV